ncbi:hypothetical protein GCM10010969_13250 [Saccharibacillus kuerlensis]|uniref:Uncharacterized protein n=1 Tax=Saccharibacillus kuerlensis TaxID=459527 RepID=A0ABQ2KXK4_9BACL|nr:hypothetical protein GCM10010969_13250 [Saccharibacillus kuerlensis]
MEKRAVRTYRKLNAAERAVYRDAADDKPRRSVSSAGDVFRAYEANMGQQDKQQTEQYNRKFAPE